MRLIKTNLNLFVLLMIVYHLSIFSCNSSNRDSNNSNRQSSMDTSISETIETTETVEAKTIMEEVAETAPSDTVYVPPVGAKYTEIRSVDPTAPPAIIDIAGNLKNEKVFKLSDIGSSVRYVYLQEPPDIKITGISEVQSDDKHIFISAAQGLFCYSVEGEYLCTLCVNQFEKMDNSNVMVGGLLMFNVDLYNGKLIFRTYNWPPEKEKPKFYHLNIFNTKDLNNRLFVDNQTVELKNTYPEPNYKRAYGRTSLNRSIVFLNDKHIFDGSSLSYLSLQGDTICKFTDFDRPVVPPNATVVSTTYQTVYRVNGQLFMYKTYNDTVFHLAPPNRFVPAYVMQWGEFKPDMNRQAAILPLDGKLCFNNLTESPRFIIIHYTEYSQRWKESNNHWAIYDKKAKTLTHHRTSPTPLYIGDILIPPMLENDIEPIGMPFWPKALTHKDEMYMIFSKEQLKAYIDTGKFDNKKLQPIYDKMADGGFILMIVT